MEKFKSVCITLNLAHEQSQIIYFGVYSYAYLQLEEHSDSGINLVL